MENKEVFNTLSQIKTLMEQSSKMLSLSGISAILVGVYACAASVIAYAILGKASYATNVSLDYSAKLMVNTPARYNLILGLAAVLLILCIGTVFFFARRKAKRNGQRFVFDHTAQKLLWSFFLPLATGGILCLSMIWQQHYGLTSSLMLVFYGLALISVSNYTYSNTRYLGYAELLLGLADSFVEGYALLFWVAGFGLFHIIYGILFYVKYDRKTVA